MAVRLSSLDDVFEQYGLSKEELNTPCSNDDCTELAMKLELLAQIVGLTQADCTAILFKFMEMMLINSAWKC